MINDYGDIIENPVLIVLDNGENVVGTVVDESGDVFIMEDMVTFVPNGQGGVHTIPYLMFSNEDKASFLFEKVRHILEPKQDLKDFYSQQFGKIQVPDSNIVVQ